MANEKFLIDANKLMVCHINVGTVMFPKMEAFVRAEDIKAAPAVDAVEVVRCKDCGHHRDYGGNTTGKVICKRFSTFFEPDFYCAYGERK